MERTIKKSKEKLKKEKAKEEKPLDESTKTLEGIPDVDFKKFLGCG